MKIHYIETFPTDSTRAENVPSVDCFAYDNGTNQCTAIDDRSGCGTTCSFRKTKAVHATSCLMADYRLIHLPYEQQTHIAQKYHNGKRTWLDNLREAVQSI